jgi:hypothetical protein
MGRVRPPNTSTPLSVDEKKMPSNRSLSCAALGDLASSTKRCPEGSIMMAGIIYIDWKDPLIGATLLFIILLNHL